MLPRPLGHCLVGVHDHGQADDEDQGADVETVDGDSILK